MVAGSTKVIDGVLLATTGTIYSLVPEEDLEQATNSWMNVAPGESFSIFTYGTSVVGTVDYDVYVDITPIGSGIAYNSADTTKYVGFKLTSSVIADDSTMHHYTSADLTKTNMDYPFCKMRIRCVGSASNPADSLIHLWVVKAN
jgi:hypothetical protein